MYKKCISIASFPGTSYHFMAPEFTQSLVSCIIAFCRHCFPFDV